MRSLLVACIVALVALTVNGADKKSPTVNVYTRKPVEFGEENELICHCTGFHPPRLSMRLMQNKKNIDTFKESDLSFGQDWTYHKMMHTKFIPREGEEYTCEVTHDEDTPRTYKLEMY